MKRLAAVIACIMLLAGCGTASPEHDFRACDWGADISQIQQSESKATCSSDSTTMVYIDTFAGQTALITYHLDEGKLMSGEIICTNTPKDYACYSEITNAYADALSGIYGRCKTEKVDVDAPVFDGSTAYKTVWETKTARVTLAPETDSAGGVFIRVSVEQTEQD